MRTYGIDGLKAHIRQHIKLGELFHSLVLSRRDLFKVVTDPSFALTVLTVIHPSQSSSTCDPGADASSLDLGCPATIPGDTLTKEVYERINSNGEIFLTSTVVNGVYAIRVVSAISKPEEKYIREAFNILVRTTEESFDKHGLPYQRAASGQQEVSIDHLKFGQQAVSDQPMLLEQRSALEQHRATKQHGESDNGRLSDHLCDQYWLGFPDRADNHFLRSFRQTAESCTIQ